MTNHRRSLILVMAVVCVGSLATPVLTGAATAVIDADASAVDPDDYDERLEANALLWSGQAVYFNGSVVVDDVADATSSERTFQIRRVTDGDRGSLVQEFVVDADGERIIETSGLQGYYVILYQGDPVYVQDGIGYVEDPPDGTSVTVDSSRWEVAEQTLEATWSDSQVYRSQPVDLEISSNRASYLLEVSAEGLDFDELVSMFDDDDFADDHDAKEDDDVLILDARDDPSFAVRFADLDNGWYTLEIAVADSDASTTTTIRVGRPSEPTPSATPDVGVTPTERITRTPEPTTSEPSQTTEPEGTGAPSPGESTATRSGSMTAESEGQPGFGFLLAVVAIGLALLVRYRR